VGLGYWLPALLVRAPDERLEGFLADLDRRWLPRIGFRDAGLRTAGRLGEPPPAESRGTSTGRWSRLFVELAELSYLSCYLVVPTGLACLYLAGFGAEADRFWVAVLLAVLPCYGLLPWLPTRPPRVVNGTASGRSAIRTLNLRVLEHGSVQFNTFPSGHVASAVATVLSVTVALPAGGLLLAPIAVGIAVGSVIGRYHYLADVIAGAAIALAAFGISRAI
jgi:membrane-associated phospholipid phosphatase